MWRKQKTNEPDDITNVEHLIDQLKIQQEQQHILISLIKKLCNQRYDTFQEVLFDRLRKRMEKFSYNAELEEDTFEIWYNRYQDIFEQECATWDEQQKKRLLVSMLDGPNHTSFTNHILPRKHADLSFTETVEILKLQFGDRKTHVRRCFEVVQLTMDPQEDIQEFINRLKAKVTKARFINLKPNHWECLLFIIGLRDSALTDYQDRLLHLLEQNDATTVDDLARHFIYWKTTKDDFYALETPQNIYVTHHSEKTKKVNPPHKMYNKNRQTNILPAPCPICNGNHWKSDCTQWNKKRHHFKTKHKRNQARNNFGDGGFYNLSE